MMRYFLSKCMLQPQIIKILIESHFEVLEVSVTDCPPQLTRCEFEHGTEPTIRIVFKAGKVLNWPSF